MLILLRNFMLIRSIGRCFRKGRPELLYGICRRYKREIFRDVTQWKCSGALEGHQLLGLARAYEMVHSSDALALSLLHDEPNVLKGREKLEVLYGRLSSPSAEDYTIVEDMLIEIGVPKSYGQYMLLIDCLGVAVRSLYSRGFYDDAGKINGQGISISDVCMDLFSKKMFLNNYIVIERSMDKNGDGVRIGAALSQMEHLDKVMRGSNA